MSINDFLNLHELDLKRIITSLPVEFSSHDFIEKFCKQFESEYIDMLVMYKGKSAFQSVHSQIALFLSKNSENLGIRKLIKNKSENVFGDTDNIQWWERI